MKYAYSYYNDTYQAMTYLFIGSKEDLDAWLRAEHGLVGSDIGIRDDENGGSFVIPHVDRGQQYFMWMDKFTGTNEDIVILGHECIHTAVMIMYRRGCTIIVDDECEAMILLKDALERIYLKFIGDDYPSESNKEKTDAP